VRGAAVCSNGPVANNAFDISIRALECQQCAAPVSAPKRGGHTTCEYCGTVNVVVTREVDAPAQASSLADEVVRLSQLKSQLEHPVTGHAYDLNRPPAGLGAHTSTAALVAAWRGFRDAPETAASPAGQHRLCWVVMTVADRKLRAGRALESRAVLETSLDVLSDAGHRHIVRCRLATEAVMEGEFEAGAGWLAECDPATEVLELDSTFREAAARVHVAREDWDAVLSVVGRTSDDIPVHPLHYSDVAGMRVHCLERLGAAGEATSQLLVLCDHDGTPQTLDALEREGWAPLTVGRRRAERSRHAVRERREEHQERFELLVDKPARRFSFFGSMRRVFITAPIWATLFFFLVLIPRCSFDVDPLLGVHGYALCPLACEGCDGPLRVVTHWNQTGPGEWTSNGPQYFCSSRKNGVATMSAEELDRRRSDLRGFELHYAPAAASWLVLLVVSLPWAVVLAVSGHVVRMRRRRRVERELQQLAEAMGVEVPAADRPGFGGFVVRGFFFSLLVIAALGIAMAEVGLHHLAP
jgi:hypothetical protein